MPAPGACDRVPHGTRIRRLFVDHHVDCPRAVSRPVAYLTAQRRAMAFSDEFDAPLGLSPIDFGKSVVIDELIIPYPALMIQADLRVIGECGPLLRIIIRVKRFKGQHR